MKQNQLFELSANQLGGGVPVVNLGVDTAGGGVVAVTMARPWTPICRKYMMAEKQSRTVTTAL